MFTQAKTALPEPQSVRIVSKTISPDFRSWKQTIQKAVQKIKKGGLEKVVLARRYILELERAPDPFAIAAALKQSARGSFVFCLENGSDAFLGATPERLFLRKGRKIWSEAMAGTRARGITPEEDLALANQLLGSHKDLSEFYPVQRYLERTLSPFCTSTPLFSPISVHHTPNVQHLYASCSGDLQEGVTDEEILSSIHPTPALCGAPQDEALSFIEQNEPFPRGLYGGAIGWSSPEGAEWIVGIRSCAIRGNTATLFAGTGIVADSDPEEEWEELNQKLKLYDSIFI